MHGKEVLLVPPILQLLWLHRTGLTFWSLLERLLTNHRVPVDKAISSDVTYPQLGYSVPQFNRLPVPEDW